MFSKLTVTPGYKPQSLDTTLEVDLLNFWLLRQRTPEQRLSMGTEMNQNARQFSINCFRQRFFHLSDHQFAQKLVQAWLGEEHLSQLVWTYNLMSWIRGRAEIRVK